MNKGKTKVKVKNKNKDGKKKDVNNSKVKDNIK